MSDRIGQNAQNNPFGIKEIYEEPTTAGWSSGVKPPGFPPSRETRNFLDSQPSSSSSRSIRLNTMFPILSADGSSVSFKNYAQPMPNSVSEGSARRVLRVNTLQHVTSAKTLSFVAPKETIPQSVSPGVGFRMPSSNHGGHMTTSMPLPRTPPVASHELHLISPHPAPQVTAAHCLPQAIRPRDPNFGVTATHAQHAATRDSLPQITIRRSDTDRKMTREEVYEYVFSSPEWKIEGRKRKNGISKGHTDYYYYNNVIRKTFRSLKGVQEYIRTKEVPKYVPKRKIFDEKSNTMVVEGKNAVIHSKKLKLSP